MKTSLFAAKKEFEDELKKNSLADADVRDFLERIRPLFQKIEEGKISVPYYEYKLGQYFGNPDLSPLADRYRNTSLMAAASKFTSTIFGWNDSE